MARVDTVYWPPS